MVVRAIDENGDWQFGNGIANYKDKQEEIKQNIITTLRSWKNDCFFDMEAGVDWYNLMGSRGREEDLKNDIIKNIMSVNGVVNIINYESFLNENREININIRLNTIYGEMEILEVM